MHWVWCRSMVCRSLNQKDSMLQHCRCQYSQNHLVLYSFLNPASGKAAKWSSPKKKVFKFAVFRMVSVKLGEYLLASLILHTVLFINARHKCGHCRLEEECTLLDQRRWMRNNFIGEYMSEGIMYSRFWIMIWQQLRLNPKRQFKALIFRSAITLNATNQVQITENK